MTGTVAILREGVLHGFIQPHDDGPLIAARRRDLPKGIAVGDEVTYSVTTRRVYPSAVIIHLAETEAPEAPPAERDPLIEDDACPKGYV